MAQELTSAEQPLNQAHHGPKMKALPKDTWRHFVMLYMGYGRKQAATAYAIAFGHERVSNADRVSASNLVHDERIQAAILEVAQRTMRGLVPGAVKVWEDILDGTTQASASEKLKAAGEVADRSGLHAVVETQHTVRLGDDKDRLERIAHMAQQLGLDPTILLGNRLGKRVKDATPEIVVEYEEVKVAEVQEPPPPAAYDWSKHKW